MTDLGLGMGVDAATLPTTRTIKMSGGDFSQVFEAEFNPNTSQLVMGGGISDRIRHDRVMELHLRLHTTGWEKATVINMHPFELRHGMGNIGELRIPKRIEGEPYSKFTIRRYRISMRDFGDAKFIPQEVLPVEMAADICLIFKDYGGIIWYRGEGEPDPEALKDAYNKQLEFYKKEYEKGLDIWARRKQISMISDHMRAAAKELFKIGAIAQLPEWCTVTRQEAERASCPSCGEDIKTKAKRCRFCGFFLDAEFAKENKERFGGSSGGFSAQNEQQIQGNLDDTKKVIDDFFLEDDPDALNQAKNLDEKIANDNKAQDTNEALKHGSKAKLGSKPQKLN